MALRIEPGAVEKMIAKGMCELTGADHPGAAWKRFFERGDVVGIKVNPVGRKRRAPMRHRTFGIVLQRLEEAFDAFLLVEAVAPVEA